MRSQVSLLSAALAVFASLGVAPIAAAGPTVGTENAVGQPVASPAAGDQEAIAIASSGSGALAVWEDERAFEDWTEGTWPWPTKDIFAARLDASGKWLDPFSLAVATETGDQLAPAVSFDGTNYVVVWIDERQAQFMSTSGGALYAARIATDGTLLDPGGVSLGGTGRHDPAIACDGPTCLTTWVEGSQILGMRLDSTFTPLDSPPLVIGDGPDTRDYPAVATNGSGWLVAWGDRRNGADWVIYGARIDADGSVLDAGGATIGGSGIRVAVGSNGDEYFVAWDSYSSPTLGTRVEPSSFVVLDPSGIPAPAGVDPSGASVVFDGTDFVLAGAKSNDTVCTIRVSPDGAASTGSCSPPMAVAPWSGVGPVLTATKGGVCALSSKGEEFDFDVYATCSDTGGTFVEPLRPFANAADGQSRVAVAFDGQVYLLVWQDDRPGTRSDIWGARIAADGTPLDPAGFAIASSAGEQVRPSVAAIPGMFLVAWGDAPFTDPWIRPIAGARVTAAGVVLDPAAITIGMSKTISDLPAPAVAADGSGFFVVWEPDDDSDRAVGVRVSAAGKVLDTTPIGFGKAAHRVVTPSAAFGAGEYLVVWVDPGSNGTGELRGARCTPAGTVLDSPGFAIGSHYYAGHVAPAVAWTGSEFLVAWQQGPDPFGRSSVLATRVSTGGSVLEPGGVPLTDDETFAGSTAVAFDGLNTLVVWQDLRSGSSFDVYGGRIGAGASVIDLGGVPIATGPTSEVAPAVASDGAGHVLAAYHRLDTDPARNVARVFYRMIDADTVPDAGTEAGADAGTDADTGSPDAGDDATAEAPDAPDEATDAPPDVASVADPGPAGDGISEDRAGCGCRAVGTAGVSRAGVLALLVVFGFASRRRSRSRLRS